MLEFSIRRINRNEKFNWELKEWSVKYPCHYDIHATIYETAYKKYQVVVVYNIHWLLDRSFDSYEEAENFLCRTEEMFIRIAKEINDKVFAYECEIVERYKMYI